MQFLNDLLKKKDTKLVWDNVLDKLDIKRRFKISAFVKSEKEILQNYYMFIYINAPSFKKEKDSLSQVPGR